MNYENLVKLCAKSSVCNICSTSHNLFVEVFPDVLPSCFRSFSPFVFVHMVWRRSLPYFEKPLRDSHDDKVLEILSLHINDDYSVVRFCSVMLPVRCVYANESVSGFPFTELSKE